MMLNRVDKWEIKTNEIYESNLSKIGKSVSMGKGSNRSFLPVF